MAEIPIRRLLQQAIARCWWYGLRDNSGKVGGSGGRGAQAKETTCAKALGKCCDRSREKKRMEQGEQENRAGSDCIGYAPGVVF